MALMPEILNRHAQKSFTSRNLSPEEVHELLEAARLSPSAKNRQAWRFVAITRKDLLEKVTAACYLADHVRSAPCVIACCTTNLDYRMPNGQHSHPVDLGIAGAFIMLQATHMGLGSCAVTTFIEGDIKQIITMPSLMKVVMLVAVGHPSPDAPAERQRLPFDRICSENSW